jgi:predicted O-methyltransferase YrrM
MSIVHRAVRTVRAIRGGLAHPPYVAPGHFYSPLTTPADVHRAQGWAKEVQSPLAGVDLREEQQLALAAELSRFLKEPAPGPRYERVNSQYGPADAAVYRAMLNHLKPARVIEVGSGFSTAVALDEIDSNIPALELTCIEPYPDRLLGLMRASDHDALTLLREPVQSVPFSRYGQLTAGDVLFIDSTHVAKAGSDVNWLFLHVMPRLAPGVVVHVHDIFWPFEYPANWLNEHRDWTEDYLLHAFLIGNTEWEILWFSSWLWQCHPELVPAELADEHPGSIWLRRVR